ncbi:MAG: glutathione synthase [Pseudomonadota bacterium]
MGLKVAIQMDPIGSIDIEADSTFRLALEASARDHELFYYHVDDLVWRQGAVQATGHDLSVQAVQGDHFTLGERRTVDLSGWDVVLLRQDPPFDMSYITNTHLLQMIHPQTLVVNDPFWVRNCPEKILVLEFLDLMPPTMVARSLDAIKSFREEQGDIIVKPLYGNGGAGVFKLPVTDSNLASLHEMFTAINREPLMIQKFLPDVSAGDKRVILIDGDVVGAINRVPQPGETRSNMHVGGTPVKTDLTDRDIEICERLKPVLKERGLIFTGIDVIGGNLTEINVTSPTGIQELERFDGVNVAALIWEAIERRRAA